MQKALVVGYTSFFGRHFIKKAAQVFDLTCLNSKNCDLLTEEIFNYKDTKYDYIFYFSVKTEAGGYCQKHPGEQFIINQIMNTRVLNYWKNIQPQAKFITFGSSCSYSDNITKSEDNYLSGLCETGYEVYGMIKRMLYVGLRSFSKEYDMKYMFYIPSCLYGPDYDKGDKHFIYDIIRKICNAKYNNGEVNLWGDGHQKRELIYVEDAVDVLINQAEMKNDIINLSSGKEYSIREYAKVICKIVDYDFSKINFDTTKFVGAREKKLVVDKLKDVDFTSIDEGIENVVKYYIDNYMESK